ncbi:MAG TPA: carbon-nitrogen hydrolase family protein [Candidatus Omnitrophota bacterium]|nr:carbon-nitrogen hydrolase family protein [Candidatus Omnitrophota bacterium]HPD84605.1 carbon-nitrogen hydrolase family protein [Candidatus Omnitrophota bacterium]HRZ03463.1 carbon-nitrogen hydrolase family protein [Candidatus Omnitrophota bacterium]
MKTALIQTNPTDDKKKNIRRALMLVRRAISCKAKFILLPEVFNYRGPADKRDGFYRIAELIPGESTRPFIELARVHKVFILAGSIYEKAPGGKRVFNASIFINDRGKIIAKYRKIHLFDAVVDGKRIKESKYFLAGRYPRTTRAKDFKVGMSICYDVRFPELFKGYGAKGANILCIPSSFTKTTGRAHWEILLRARAIENLCYVLAPNQAGQGQGSVVSYGNSMAVDPWGKVIARAGGEKEEIIYADLSLEAVKRARKTLPGMNG